MVLWAVITTETFSEILRKFKKNKQLLTELDKKIIRLKKDPNSVGGLLSGSLHGLKSTRLTGKFRLIFKIDNKKYEVYLYAIDHRKFNYKRF